MMEFRITSQLIAEVEAATGPNRKLENKIEVCLFESLDPDHHIHLTESIDDVIVWALPKNAQFTLKFSNAYFYEASVNGYTKRHKTSLVLALLSAALQARMAEYD